LFCLRRPFLELLCAELRFLLTYTPSTAVKLWFFSLP